jgi:hypothetical protein
MAPVVKRWHLHTYFVRPCGSYFLEHPVAVTGGRGSSSSSSWGWVGARTVRAREDTQQGPRRPPAHPKPRSHPLA